MNLRQSFINKFIFAVECCVGVEVWNIATRGLCTVGQEEMVVLLEVAPGETHPPRDIFAFFHTVYQQANQGKEMLARFADVLEG